MSGSPVQPALPGGRQSCRGDAMRIVALEEHFAVPSLVKRIDPQAIAQRGFPVGFVNPLLGKLADLGDERLAEMDEAGVAMQVLSLSGPGADLIDGAEGVAF